MKRVLAAMFRGVTRQTGRIVVVGGGLLSIVALMGGCGEALLTATFTSRVVQLETCRTVGGVEGCVADERITERQLELVEVQPDVFWLYGVRRDGVEDRAILGSRDTTGGFLFVDERQQLDPEGGCSLTTRLSISLAVDPEADVATVGADACIALVGRSVETATSSAPCDTVNIPPQEVTRTVRQRFEPLDAASDCGS